MAEKIGIMVVHGVGDPAPGATVRSVTETLSHVRPSSSEPDPVAFRFEPVAEKSVATRHLWHSWKIEVSPMFIRRGTARRQSTGRSAAELVFVEVFWGSASQVPAGLLGVAQGLIRLFFQSEALIFAAAESHTTQPRGRGCRRLFYWLATHSAYLLTGPILALNVLLFLVLLFYESRAPATPVHGQQVVSQFIFWGSSVQGLLISLAVLGLNHTQPNTFLKHLEPSAQWLLGLIISWGLWYWLRGLNDIEAVIAPLTTALAIAFLVVAGSIALVIMVRALHGLLAEGGNLPPNRQGPPLTIALFTVIAQYGLWIIVIPLLWNLLLRDYEADDLPKQLYARAAPTAGVWWLAILMMACFGLLALAHHYLRTRYLKARSNPQAREPHPVSFPGYAKSWLRTHWRRLILHRDSATASEPYRLIIHPLIMTPLAGVSLLLVLFILWVGIVTLLKAQLPTCADLIMQWVNSERTSPRTVALLIVGIALLGSELRLGIDLINDVINYIDQNRSRRRPERKKLPHTPAAPPQPARPLMGAIRPRFRLVLEHILQAEKVDHLIIMAHSQGSVIALDELAEATNQPLQHYQGPITLITMGSPFSHFYQHYFPGNYPPWSHASRWQHLFARVGRWRHYYRIDDFIGMAIEPSVSQYLDFAQDSLSDGGHADYWQDERFVEKLQNVLTEVISM